MTAPAIAQQIRTALEAISRSNLEDPRLDEVLSLATQLTDTMKLFFSSMDQSVYGEFRYIAQYIQRTRDEIAALRPNSLIEERIPTAGAELDAVVKDTETATEKLMQEAENVLTLEPGDDPDGYKAAVDDAMMRMMEACSFQDLTGQRVSKVVTTITHIEERLSQFAVVMGVTDADVEKSEKDQWREENLLNGPAIGGPVVAQDTIDALFGDEDQADQGAVDKLFD